VEPFILESCNSTWLFDTERMRFRRVLKGIDVGRHQAATEWRLYFRLDLDPRSESFVVVLNADGTRLLRSWRHTEQCAQCGGQATAELSLGEVRAASA
jgi:GH25 family lysozyme M1 (1,4-beta-N-acetylmuramidase)